MRDPTMHGQISHRIVPADGPDLRIWPTEPDATDLAGCMGQILCEIWPAGPDLAGQIWPCRFVTLLISSVTNRSPY
jgi:hypothetical protein